MKGEALSKAQTQLSRDMAYAHLAPLTAATVRQFFIVKGKRFTGRLEAKDSTIPVAMEMKPRGAEQGMIPVAEIAVVSKKQPAPSFEELKIAWEVFQDIGDCKLPRKGSRGTFPAMDAVGAGREVITDTWEGEGIRIELLVKSVADPVLPDPSYMAVLRATEAATQPAK